MDQAWCPQCQAQTRIEWEPELAVEVCTQCGNVLESSASAGLEARSRVLPGEDGEAGRIRIGDLGSKYVGGGLSHDKKAAYHRKKQSELVKHLNGLLNKYQITGLLPRTQNLLNSCRGHINLTWGPRTRLISTACVYIAAREQEKSVRLAELSDDVGIPQMSLARSVQTVKFWLSIKLKDEDPILFVEAPLVHLVNVFKAPEPTHCSGKPWFDKNIEAVRDIDWGRVRNTASGLLVFSGELKFTLGRAPASVACAAIIVAIEAVLRKLLPISTEFIEELASFIKMKPFTISERYRDIIRVLGDYSRHLPWVASGSNENLRKAELIHYVEDIIKFRRDLESDRQAARAAQHRQQEQERALAAAQAGDEYDDGLPPLPELPPLDPLSLDDVSANNVDESSMMFERDPLDDQDAADALIALGHTESKGRIAAGSRSLGASARKPRSSVAAVSPSVTAIGSCLPQPGLNLPGLFLNGSPPRTEPLVQEPASFKRQRDAVLKERPPGMPIKKYRTIERVAKSLLTPFSSQDPPKLEIEATVSNKVGSNVSRSLSHPGEDDNPLSPKDTDPFALHSEQSVHYRQLLLAGFDPDAVLAGKASLDDSMKKTSGRLSHLLWHKTVDELNDDELFDGDELAQLLRTPDEVQSLLHTPKYRQMVVDCEEMEHRKTDGVQRRPIRQRKRRKVFEPSEVQKRALKAEAERQGVPVPIDYEPAVDQRTVRWAPGGGLGGTGGLQRSRKSKVTDATKASLIALLAEGDEMNEAAELDMAEEVARKEHLFDDEGDGEDGDGDGDGDDNADEQDGGDEDDDISSTGGSIIAGAGGSAGGD